MQYIFLSQYFYSKYPVSLYPQIEQKQTRPYIQVLVKSNGITFAVPMRSNIQHPHAFWTDKKNRCGVDYSKAVVITDISKEIDHNTQPYIRPNEFKALLGKEYRLQVGLEKYIRTYENAKLNQNDEINKKICNFSTLQYFESVIWPNGINKSQAK